MSGIVGVFRGNTLRLWRRMGRRWAFWRAVCGTEAELLRALAAARELDDLASALGGWAKALRLSLDPVKPRQAFKVVPRLVAKNDLDSHLG